MACSTAITKIYMQDEFFADVLETSDYTKFKLLPGNRSIHPFHVSRLAKSMEEDGFLPCPILVNESFEILDGQHRWSAAKQTGVPLLYIIAGPVDDVSAREVVHDINQNQQNWTLAQFEESYCKLAESGEYGNQYDDYLRFREFRKKWGLPYSKCTNLLGRRGIGAGKINLNAKANGSFDGETRYRDCPTTLFRNGKYEIRNMEYATKVMEAYYLLEDILPSQIFHSSIMIDCYILLMRNPLFDPEIFKNRLLNFQKRSQEFMLYKHRGDMLRQFEDIYNYGVQEKNRVFLFNLNSAA